MKQNRLYELFADDKSPAGYYRNYSKYLNELMSSLNYDAITKVSNCFLDAREKVATIFFCR